MTRQLASLGTVYSDPVQLQLPLAPTCHSSLLLAAALLTTAACSDLSRDERTLAHADAEAFEAVVRSEMQNAQSDSTALRRALRFDPRPVDNTSLVGAKTKSAPGFELDSAPVQVSAAALRRAIEQRQEILQRLEVEEGGPFLYPDCGGTHVRMSDRNTVSPRNAKCPSEWRRYITVGLPQAGIADFLAKFQRPELPAVDSSGEVWTVLVTESSVGPGGQDWRQYAWILRRDAGNSELKLVERLLLSWAE